MIPEGVARELLAALYNDWDRRGAGHNDGAERLVKAADALEAALDHVEPVGYRVRHRDWQDGGLWSFLNQDSQTVRQLTEDDDWEVQPVYA